MKTQALGWLTVAVLAAGLNANYHDGGLEWAHRAIDRIGHNTNAVLAVATGNTQQFLAEARVIAAHARQSQCPLETVVADVERATAPAHSEVYQFEAMSARQEATLARLEANRARIEAQVARIRIPAVAFNPVVVRAPYISVCPRVRVNVPRMPRVRVSAPRMVSVETFNFGPA